MKTAIFIISFFIYPFIKCDGQIIEKYINENNIEMKKLDIITFREKLTKLKSQSTVPLIDKTASGKINFDIEEDMIKFQGYVNIDSLIRQVSYAEYHDDKSLYIFGNEIQGFSSLEKKDGANIEEQAEFYGDGTLKLLGTREYYGDRKERAIGTWYEYDKNGNLLIERVYNYDDSLYVFSLDDVHYYIKNRYAAYTDSNTVDQKKKMQDIRSGANLNYYEVTDIMKSPQVITNGEVTSEPFWTVTIWETPIKGYRVLRIDGKTGDIIYESTGVPTKC